MAAAAARFAGQALLSRLGGAFKAAMPKPGAEMLMEFGPNALFAVGSALMAPEGTDLGTRIGAGAEDAIGNFGLDMGLRMLGGPAASRLAKARGLAKLDDSTEAMVRGAISMGGSTALNMSGLMPRYFMNKAYEGYQDRFDAEQQQQLALRDQAIREQVIREMGGYAPLAEPMISAGYTFGVDPAALGALARLG
jgi:hypothetical protein